jgi:hypothetical protein
MKSCGEYWQRASAFTGGPTSDKHLETCSFCRTKKAQLISLTGQMAQMPWKSPSFSPHEYLVQQSRWAGLRTFAENLLLTLRISKWSQIPLAVRASLEVIGIAVLGLSVLSGIPRMKGFIEETRKRNLTQELALLDSFDDPSVDGSNETSGQPIDPLAEAPTSESLDSNSAEDEFQDDAATADSPEIDQEDPSTSAGPQTVAQEVWRFHLKTDTPIETAKAVETLLKERGAKSTRNPQAPAQGLRVPGGIQFDLAVPSSAILEVKDSLNALVETNEQAIASRTNTEARIENGKTHFTWYRSPAKKKVPVGHSRVVIWISQI